MQTATRPSGFAWRIAISALGVGLCLGLSGCGPIQDWQHHRVVRQIETHLKSHPASGLNPGWPLEKPLKDEDARAVIHLAISTTLGNEIWIRRLSIPEKLKAVAARLDADGGADFKTAEGSLRIMDLLEQACPTARDYDWFARIHQEQARGYLPATPK